MATAQTDIIKRIPPEEILADDNSRFSLKKTRIESLKQSILDAGDVLTPIEVEPLEKPEGKAKYRLTAGFYRHQAATELNAEQGAGLLLPALVREVADDKTRLMHQLAENMERENQSPMDQAVAIQKLIDAGVARKEIRRIFSRPWGRKGLTLEPASNAWVNMTLRLLEMPKAIQEKVHDGRVGFEAAYLLGRVSPDKRVTVLERAETERQARLDMEEKDEENYLKAERKLTEAEQKAADATKDAEGQRSEVTRAQELIAEKTATLRALQAEPYLTMSDAEKKVLTEKLKGAETDVKAAQKLLKDAENKVAKSLNTARSAAETADEHRAKLEAARKALKAKPKNAKPVGAKDVKAAAKAEGEDTGVVKLNASQMRDAVRDVSKAEHKRVAAIGAAVLDCFNSKLTPKELINELGLLTGEVRKAATPAAKAS